MEPLSPSFIEGCRRDGGRILRGENMSRIETFVDAAFAFAFTMLVISIDEIPDTPRELLLLAEDIPAFIFSTMVIGAIWIAHATWSRTFGLQDRVTLHLSLSLVVLVLIFVYPIKLMIQISVYYVSRGNLGRTPAAMSVAEVADLFVFFNLGLIGLALLVMAFYLNTLRFRKSLLLTRFEMFYCRRSIMTWLVVALTALLSLLYVLFANRTALSWAGFIYVTLLGSLPLTRMLMQRRNERRLAEQSL